MSYFSHMVALAAHNWLSARDRHRRRRRIGARDCRRHSARASATSGSDITRAHALYVLAPLSAIVAIVLVSQGVIANFSPYTLTVTR